jgi:hypothetical protein
LKKLIRTGKRKNLFYCLMVLIVIIFLAVFINSDISTSIIQSRTSVYDLPAAHLHSDYKKNEGEADSKYKGKVIIVYGNIIEMEQEKGSDSYVLLGLDDFPGAVRCLLSEREFARAQVTSRLLLGKHLHVKGKVKGFVDGYVLLKGCRVL